MKKIYLLCYLIFFMITLSSCKNYYEIDKLKCEVKNVEIVYRDVESSRYDPFIFKKALTNDEFDLYLNEIAKIKFTSIIFGDRPNINGYCFKMIYHDGSYVIISSNFTEKYDKNNELIKAIWQQCSKKEFEQLISKFIVIDE